MELKHVREIFHFWTPSFLDEKTSVMEASTSPSPSTLSTAASSPESSPSISQLVTESVIPSAWLIKDNPDFYEDPNFAAFNDVIQSFIKLQNEIIVLHLFKWNRSLVSLLVNGNLPHLLEFSQDNMIVQLHKKELLHLYRSLSLVQYECLLTLKECVGRGLILPSSEEPVSTMKYSPEIVACLEESFEESTYVSRDERRRLQNCTGLSDRQIMVW
jgi:hypothetical protein